MMRRATWTAPLLMLAVGAGTAGAQTSVETCIINNGPKYSTPGDAASAQYVDMGGQCKDAGVARTQVTITPTTKRTRRSSTSGGGTGATSRTPTGSGTVAPTASTPSTASGTPDAPARGSSTRHAAGTKRVDVAASNSLPTVQAALASGAQGGGIGAGGTWEMATTPAGTALIIAIALGGAGIGIRRFGRDRHIPPKD